MSVIILLLLQSCLFKNEIDKETYYIPEGFTGKVLVLFNCKDGKPEEWVNGRRLYEIPPSGVLKTQFKPNTGSRHEYDNTEKQIKSLREYYKFYYVNNNGSKKLLDYNYRYISKYKHLFNESLNVTSSVVVFGFGSYNNEDYLAMSYYISKGVDSNLEIGLEYTGSGITSKDWYRINHWNTFNAITDSLPKVESKF